MTVTEALEHKAEVFRHVLSYKQAIAAHSLKKDGTRAERQEQFVALLGKRRAAEVRYTEAVVQIFKAFVELYEGDERQATDAMRALSMSQITA